LHGFLGRFRAGFRLCDFGDAEYDAELILLHVLERVPSPNRTEQAIAEATGQLEKLLPPERCKLLKFKTEVRIGKPYQQIIEFARETQTDLTTMGVRGRGRWILRGSV
jgi:nucleotide-binding universal stress UspA family protein